MELIKKIKEAGFEDLHEVAATISKATEEIEATKTDIQAAEKKVEELLAKGYSVFDIIVALLLLFGGQGMPQGGPFKWAYLLVQKVINKKRLGS